MHVIRARNVGSAYIQGVNLLSQHGVRSHSRYGDVLVMPEPVTTVYERPWERVVFEPVRDCNPFFHFFEALWMLDGRRDVEFVSKFNSRIKEFSDDGKIFHAAYGYRWRTHFGFEDYYDDEGDQLHLLVKELKENPLSRRAILQMWDPAADLNKKGKDFPCNVSAKFEIVDGCLNMMVFNRSNDIIFGCYGANAVHFSMLQEYVAAMVGVPMGKYWQISCNYHAYINVWQDKVDAGVSRLRSGLVEPNYYEQGMATYPMVECPETWLKELRKFLQDGDFSIIYNNHFFMSVALPMFRAWQDFKQKDWQEAFYQVSLIKADDWKSACFQWLMRRKPSHIFI